MDPDRLEEAEYLDALCKGCNKPLLFISWRRRYFVRCVNDDCAKPTVIVDTQTCGACGLPCAIKEYPLEPCDCAEHDEDFIEVDTYFDLECDNPVCPKFGKH